MILSIDVYVLLVMLNFLNRFLIMQLRQILIVRSFNLPLPLLLSLLNLHPYLHQLSLALYPYYYTCIYFISVLRLYTRCHFLLHGCRFNWSPLYGYFIFSGWSSISSSNPWDRQPPAWYRSFMTTCYSLEFVSFLLLYILYRKQSRTLKL